MLRARTTIVLGLLLALAGLSAPAACGAGFLVRTWGNEEGLPHSMVNSLAQTRNGFLWLGTDAGLVRFDGARFVPFAALTRPELDLGGVSKLFEDRDSTLWIGLENGGLLSWQNGSVRTHVRGGTGFHQAVVAMAQDATGTLWLQTSEGRLGRLAHEQVEFVATTGPAPRAASLGLAVESGTNLWVGTGEGLKLWHQGRLVDSACPASLRGRPVEALGPARDGAVWIFTERRLHKLRAGEVVAQFDAPSQLNAVVIDLLETARHDLWLAALDGSLFCLAPDGAWQAVPMEKGLRGPNRTLCEDREGNIWRGSAGGGLSQLRPEMFTVMEMPASMGYSLILSFEGSPKWPPGPGVLTLDNVLLETLSPLATNYAQDFNAPGATAASAGWDGGFAYAGAEAETHTLAAAGVDGSGGLTTSLQVRDGPSLGAFTEYWSGSLALPPGANPDTVSLTAMVAGNQAGAPFSLKLNDHFGHYVVFNSTVEVPGRFQSVGGLLRSANFIDPAFNFGSQNLDRYAFSLCSDRAGNLWVQPNAHTLVRLAAGTPRPQARSGPTIPQQVRTLFSDRRDTLWAGTEGGYLYKLQHGTFVPVLRVDEKADFISALFEDAASNLWVGFTPGAGVGVLPGGDPGKWRAVPGLPVPDVRAIAQTADGAMWFGTYYRGALRLKDGQWTRYTQQDGLPSDYVRCLHPDADGTLWLGTIHGLCRWRNGKLCSITTENGLWNDALSHIEEDRRGNLWMSSLGGIFRVSRQELNEFAEGRRALVQCIGYNRHDGLPSQECAGGFQPAGAKTPDGRLWFPTGGGVVGIEPEQVPENQLPPPVWMEEVVVQGVDQPLPQGMAPLTIRPGQRRFEFRFTAPSLTAPEKVRFRHKLEGLDRDWSTPADSRSATYSFVPPGRYTFRVRACNPDGVWNPTGAALVLVVQPYFWQTIWFQAGAALGLAALLVGSVRGLERWRARLRLERLEQKHALEHERARISRDIHDDLGASLTQIVFLSEQADSVRAQPAEVERWHQRIRTAARNSIRSLDEIVWAVSPKHDTLESLANYLSQFVLEHLGLAGVQCLLKIPTVLPAVELSAEVRHNLLLAVREAVQNIVAHAAASEVQVKLHLDPEALEISVVDNGRGFQPGALNAQGHGLANMRRRLERIGGEFELTSQAGAGTTLRFRLPHARFRVRPEPESKSPPNHDPTKR